LDELLSAVDWITRGEIARGVRRLQERLRITTIYVTHDMDEALSLGHRVMVMNQGCLEQCSTPEELIREPKSEFIRRFVLSTSQPRSPIGAGKDE